MLLIGDDDPLKTYDPPMKLVNNVVEFLSSPSPVVHHWCVALICGSPLCGPTLCGSPPPSVNLHLNVSQAFVPARPPPPSVYWSRFFDNFPGLSNIWGSPRPSLAHGAGAVLRMSLLWVWGQTVGFVTAKWLYLRWDCPLRSGTILTPNSSLGVKAATDWRRTKSSPSLHCNVQVDESNHFLAAYIAFNHALVCDWFVLFLQSRIIAIV